MKVNITQWIALNKDKSSEYRSISKTYETSLVPIVGSQVFNMPWNDSKHAEITSVVLDFQQNCYNITIEIVDCKGDIDLYDSMTEIAKTHGWNICP